MFSTDWYEFAIESPKNSTQNLRFICALFSAGSLTFGIFPIIQIGQTAENLEKIKKAPLDFSKCTCPIKADKSLLCLYYL